MAARLFLRRPWATTRFLSIAATPSPRASRAPAYVCNSCGHDTNKWHGRCPSCSEYDTMVAFQPRASPRAAATARGGASWLSGASAASSSRLTPLGSVVDAGLERIPMGSGELDRLLGGGLTAGSSVLFAGAPGVGKSTLLLQMAALLSGASAAGGGSYSAHFCGRTTHDVAAAAPMPPPRLVAYVSGEESAGQLKARASRLGIAAPGLLVLNETRIEDVIAQLDAAMQAAAAAATSGDVPASFAAIVIDSIQTMHTDALPAPAGTVTQVRECAVRLASWARSSGVPIFLVGHVTKSGDIAGPRVLEHVVDTVLFIEGEDSSSSASSGWGGGGGGGDAVQGLGGHSHRIVRAIKNRFGSTSEVGLFNMTDGGFVESDPAALFLSHGVADAAATATTPPSGCAVAVTAEGSRCLCVEVQALVTRALAPYPRLRAMGVHVDRLHLLSAVLGRYTSLKPGALLADVLVNIVGGLRLSDPSCDLAIAMAIASSTARIPLPRGTAFIGELGLAGELRGTLRMNDRVRAAAKLGFSTVYAPHQGGGGGSGGGEMAGLRIIHCRSLAEVVSRVFGDAAAGGGGGRVAPSPTLVAEAASAREALRPPPPLVPPFPPPPRTGADDATATSTQQHPLDSVATPWLRSGSGGGASDAPPAPAAEEAWSAEAQQQSASSFIDAQMLRIGGRKVAGEVPPPPSRFAGRERPQGLDSHEDE